jgi:hypothetical protein
MYILTMYIYTSAFKDYNLQFPFPAKPVVPFLSFLLIVSHT